MKNRMILLMIISVLFMLVFNKVNEAGVYKHTINISFGGVSVDSVRAWIMVDTVRVDSVLWTSFPQITHVNVQDTAPHDIAYWVYYDLDDGTYKTSGEHIPEPPEPIGIYDLKIFVVNTTPDPDDSLSGVAVEIENAGGHKYPGKVTDDSGSVLFTVGDGIWTIRTYTPLAQGDTTKIDMAGSDQTVLHDVTTTALPAAVATSDYVLAYADVTRGVIDTLTGLYVAATDMEVKIFLVNGDHFTNNAFIIIPEVYTATPDGNGRVRFVLPANTKLSPPGSYYEMFFKGFGGRTLGGGLIKRFIVDTIPDPLDISTAPSVR